LGTNHWPLTRMMSLAYNSIKCIVI
jgi:hypothetical protein